MNNNPFLSVSCDKCKVPINSDTRYEYLCGHIICRICDTGRSCQYCGHPGPSNQHNNNDTSSCSNDICEACEDTALYYCVTCPKLLCERCAHIHSASAIRKDHQVVYLKDYPRQIPDTQVNYDVPEHVYLARKRTVPESSEEEGPAPRRRKPPLERSDTWDRTAESRKPFRKNPPIKQFSYSKSVSSRASSVQSIHDMMEKLSEKSYDKFSMKSEKSVGTDVSGLASMIKNNNFTIMVYNNSEAGSVSSGPPGKIRVIKNPDPSAEVEASLNRPVCKDCGHSKTSSENGDYHDHGVYIQRKVSTLSSDSTTSFSSHCCESHLEEEYSRSKSRGAANAQSLVSKSDTMDNISDILNVSNDPRRSTSPRELSLETRGTSPGLFVVTSEDGYSEPADEVMVDEHLYSPAYSSLPRVSNKCKEIPLLHDKDDNGVVKPKEHSTPNKDSKIDAILDAYGPSPRSSSMTSKSSTSSNDSKHSLGQRLLKAPSISSKESSKSVDDLLDKYNDPVRDNTETETDTLHQSNVTDTSGTDEPCMIPIKSTGNSPELSPHPSPLLQRVRSQSLGKDSVEFIDENLYDSTASEDEEEEEVFEGNETYLTHSSHYSTSEDGSDNLSNIVEEPTLETCSATEVAECKVESVTDFRIDDMDNKEFTPELPEPSVEVNNQGSVPLSNEAPKVDALIVLDDEEPSIKVNNQIYAPLSNEAPKEDALVVLDDEEPTIEINNQGYAPLSNEAPKEDAFIIFDDEEEEMIFEVESIGDDGDNDVMVTEERFLTVNTVPDFTSSDMPKEDEDDKMSGKSQSSMSSKASSKKQFSYSKSAPSADKDSLKSPSTESDSSRSRPSSSRKSSRDSASKIPLPRSPSGEKLKKSLSRESFPKSSSKGSLQKSPSRESIDKGITKSPSSGSLSRIPVRRSSRDSSDDLIDGSLEGPKRRASSGSTGRNSRRSSRSSSNESLSRIPVRRLSQESPRRHSRDLSKSSSQDSLSIIPRSTSKESLKGRKLSQESPRRHSRDLSKSSSQDSLSRIPRSTSKESLKSSSERSGKSKDSKSSSTRGATPVSKPPLPRSPSEESTERKKDVRSLPNSESRDSFETDGKQDKSENLPVTKSSKEISEGETNSASVTPLARSPSKEVFEGKGMKTFSRSLSKDSVSGKSDKSESSRRSSASRRSPSPSKIPIARSPSNDSIGRSSVSSKGSFAYKRTKSPSNIPVPRSSSRDSGIHCNPVSSNTSEPYSHGKSLSSRSTDSVGSKNSTISNQSEHRSKDENPLACASTTSSVSVGDLRRQFERAGSTSTPPANDNLPHHRKDSSSSSGSSDHEPPNAYFGVIGIDKSEAPAEVDTQTNTRHRNSSRNSDRSVKSANSVNSKHSSASHQGRPSSRTGRAGEDDSLSECSGSFISDNSFLRKQHPQTTYSDSEDSNNPVSTKKIMLDRILSGGYSGRGENLGFMDNLSDGEGSLTGVSSEGIGKVGSEDVQSDGSTVWREGQVEPISITSIDSSRCKHIVIGEEPEGTEPVLDTLYFPTMSDYVKWSQNQSISGRSFDADSVRSMEMYDDIEYSDGEKTTLEREMLYKYAKYKRQQSLADLESRKLEDILSMDEMSLTSSKLGSDGGSNVMSVYSLDELASSSTSTIVDEEEGMRHEVYQGVPDGMYPPRYFDKEERSASVASRDLPEEDVPIHRAPSETSLSSSLYSAVSNDLGHYVDAFNDAMEPHNQPAAVDTSDTFNRKYSKRVSALQKTNKQQSATLPRNRKSTQSSEERVKQTYTLPRKQTKEPGALTNFLNQTYAGRVPPPKSSDSKLLSRSLTFGSVSDYKKFSGDEWARSLPRHLGRKTYMRHPSLRQVDWSVMGRKGTEPGFLMNPSGIAVDEGCVAIAEEGNGRIQIFIEDESEYCINSLVNPCGIALSRDHIYVSDIDTNVIKIYGRNALEKAVLGGPGSQKGQFNEPRGVAFNPCNGDLAVCDTENHRVQIFDVRGNFIKTIGKKGKNKGDFREPISCTYDRWGRLLISDHCNYRVQIFDNNYQYITDFGKYGKSSGEFWGVNGLCSHLNGDILVVDSDNNCLSVHSSDGRFISVFGRRGAERWEFLYPHSVGTDEVGNVYVSDWGNHRIHIMDKKLLPYLELESHML